VRRFLTVLLVLALPLAQAGAQLHALAHAAHDLASMQGGAEDAPPLDHPLAKCLVFHAADNMLSSSPVVFEAQRFDAPLFAPVLWSFLSLPRIAFDARAPPKIS
jgi:hypothetical protein